MTLLRFPFEHFFTHAFLDLLQAIELPCVLLGWLQSSDDSLECFLRIGGFGVVVVVDVVDISGGTTLVSKKVVRTAAPNARRRKVEHKISFLGSIFKHLFEFLSRLSSHWFGSHEVDLITLSFASSLLLDFMTTLDSVDVDPPLSSHST